MIIVKTKFELSKVRASNLVYVESVGKLYRRMDGEWIERVYVTVPEIAGILQVDAQRVRRVINKHRLRKKGSHKGFTIAQMEMISKEIVR